MNTHKPEIVIREAHREDLTAVCEIYNHYILNSVITFDIEPLDVEHWQEKYADLNALGMPFIVATNHEGLVLGYAYVGPWRTKAAYRRTVENSIYLHPEATNMGIGPALLKELISSSRQAGLTQIVAVISDQEAEISLAMHEKFGFENRGHLANVGFKFGRWLGVVMMQLAL